MSVLMRVNIPHTATTQLLESFSERRAIMWAREVAAMYNPIRFKIANPSGMPKSLLTSAWFPTSLMYSFNFAQRVGQMRLMKEQVRRSFSSPAPSSWAAMYLCKIQDVATAVEVQDMSVLHRFASQELTGIDVTRCVVTN